MERKFILLLALISISLAREHLRPQQYEDKSGPMRPHRRDDNDDRDDGSFRPHRDMAPEQRNFRPVIGVLTLPIHPYENWNTTASTYVAASYVKYLEMGGARVVPLRIDQSFEELSFLFSRINGILFTGGDANMWDNSTYPIPTFSPDYTQKTCFLYNLVKQANDNGNYFPLWGTCLGFEAIQVCENNEYDTLSNYDGEPPSTQYNDFTEKAKFSRLFNALGHKYGSIIRKTMAEKQTSLLSHSQGVSPDLYTQQNNLTNTFDVLSTMLDKSGNRFVAIIEAKKYPIYATQFHPEKNLYEWDPTIPQPHDEYSIKVSTYLANFLASEARRNNNTFASEQELKPYLIYNWWPLYTNDYFTQTYEFK